MEAEAIFPGVFRIGKRLATINLVRGRKVYGEELIGIGKTEYRLWNPYRSKLAAAILNGMREMHIKDGSNVLYIGAATGTTPSHVSDIVGRGGSVYALELSERNMRNLIAVCETRKNMLPILADAMHTESYEDMVGECDILYQDASAREQAALLLKNSKFLKKNGYAYFIIKSQSIDISKKPKDVYEEELKRLEGHFRVVERLSLEPYDSMHLFAVLKKL